jgi:hypothetical protein
MSLAVDLIRFGLLGGGAGRVLLHGRQLAELGGWGRCWCASWVLVWVRRIGESGSFSILDDCSADGNDPVCAFSIQDSLQRNPVSSPQQTSVRYIQSTVRPVNSAGPRTAATAHARACTEESQLRVPVFQLAKKCYNSQTKKLN